MFNSSYFQKASAQRIYRGKTGKEKGELNMKNYREKSVYGVTPIGICVYPFLRKPEVYQGKKSWGVSVRFTDDNDLVDLSADIIAAADRGGILNRNNSDMYRPLKRYEDGTTAVKFKTTIHRVDNMNEADVRVYGTDGKPLPAGTYPRPGDAVKVSYHAVAYEYGNRRGVSLYLDGIQIMESGAEIEKPVMAISATPTTPTTPVEPVKTVKTKSVTSVIPSLDDLIEIDMLPVDIDGETERSEVPVKTEKDRPDLPRPTLPRPVCSYESLFTEPDMEAFADILKGVDIDDILLGPEFDL
ncbi:hypothetical protein EOM86_07475 [Candidatus Nomurabacteria bacterium]|nr:hypothetical protein [Candidatus Nomurabacteria bacterium]